MECLNKVSNNTRGFYRAMHYIVQSRGLAIVICPSVRTSVCDVGGSGPYRAISPTPSLFVAQRLSAYSQRYIGKFWGDYRGGVRKSGVLEHKSGNT